jgi:Peptidase family M23
MISPGGTSVVLMDVSFGKGDELPSTVSARITATRQASERTESQPPCRTTARFQQLSPSPERPPLSAGKQLSLSRHSRGGWVAVNGCCDSITSHRGAVLAINGQLRVPERFAIDWVKLDDSGHLFAGDVSRLPSYAYYGTPIHAAADGVVVNLYDDTDEQVPGADAKGITTENIGGNMLVIDIGGGAFTFYAHMQRGSLKVKLGDRVKTGLGLLGNSGNSTAPHLHFHVMDGPSPLDANGLPFVFTHFSSPGVLAAGSDDAIQEGQPAKLTRGSMGTTPPCCR